MNNIEPTQNARPALTKLIRFGHGVAAFHGANVPITNSTNANTSKMVVNMVEVSNPKDTPKPEPETVQKEPRWHIPTLAELLEQLRTKKENK